MLCCFDLEHLLRGCFPLMLRWQNGDYILKCLHRHVSFLFCLAGKEVRLAMEMLISVKNIPLIWGFSTDNEGMVFLYATQVEQRVELGQNPVSLFSRCSPVMHWDFPVSTSCGWTQAIQDKISPLSGWKSSHEYVNTVWEHPRSSLRSWCTEAGGKSPMILSDQAFRCMSVVSRGPVTGKRWGLSSRVQSESYDSTN